jgi:hypothetical protein
MSLLNIPDELKAHNNWVGWRREQKKNSRGVENWTKPPYDLKSNGTLRHAETDNPETWAPFDAVEASCFSFESRFDGAGFVLPAELGGVDFDGVLVDEKAEPFVLEILKHLGNPYTEITPSDTGLRAFFNAPILPVEKGRKFHGKKKGVEKYGAEIYFGAEPGRYLTVTGKKFSGEGVPTPADIDLAHFMISQIGNEKLKSLWMADLAAYKDDQSAADLALLGILARLLNNDTKRMEKYFGASLLGHREKWTGRPDYRERTIKKAISGHEPKNEPSKAPQVEIDDEKQAAAITPEYPSDTIDGDLIGELTRALTDGTFIPPQFMRENIKVALGSILDGFVGFPNHEDLHTREYLHNVSVYPQSGKGESFKRSIAYPTGFLSELLKKFGVTIVDGGLFGSGEFMVKILKDAPTHRSIARFDEMSEVWSKNRALGCTLEKKLLTLFEGTSAAQGSFKNGVHADSDFHVSVVGDFTKDSFDASFTGSGSRGSGYLSRCIFQFADKRPLAGDWQLIDTEKVRHILSDIEVRLTEILSHDGPFIPTESADAKLLRSGFYAWLDTQDARYIPRLKDHLKRDVLLRAVISSGGTITAEMMRRSIEWCKNQLDNRIALFPEDAGSLVEIMERGILRGVTVKGQASERDLKRVCNVCRAGSGGYEVFNRALRSLVFGHEIKVVGKNRTGLPVYARFDAA